MADQPFLPGPDLEPPRRGPAAPPRSTQRHRLLLAFNLLERYGILARPAVATEPCVAHAELTVELRARHPHGLVSYAFWSRRDDRHFDDRGWLTVPLPIHCDGDETIVAVSAAATQTGLVSRRQGPSGLVIDVEEPTDSPPRPAGRGAGLR